MSNEPKPCAHCGGDHVVEEWVGHDNCWRRWRVMCDRCGISTDWHGTREFALGVWNNRPNETAIDTDGLTAERDHFHKHVNRMMDLIADIARKQPHTFDPEAPYETLDMIGNYLDELKEQVDTITAERDRLKRRLKTQEAYIANVEDDLCRYASQLVRNSRDFDKLTAERDKWKTEYETWEVAYKQADAENDRLRHQADELVCKIGEITDAASELLRKQPYSFNPGDVVGSLKTVGKYIERLTTELEAYKTFWESSK